MGCLEVLIGCLEGRGYVEEKRGGRIIIYCARCAVRCALCDV